MSFKKMECRVMKVLTEADTQLADCAVSGHDGI